MMSRASVAFLVLGGAAALVLVAGSLLPTNVMSVAHAEMRSTLPAVEAARSLLNATHRHREWMTVPVSASSSTLAWVMYPERTDRAPVIFLSDEQPDADEWSRAISDQLAAEGYMVVVPDVLTTLDAAGDRLDARSTTRGNDVETLRRLAAVRRAALALPSAGEVTLQVDLNRASRTIQVATPGGQTAFPLSADAWPSLVAHLNRVSGNVVAPAAGAAHADHLAMQAQVSAGAGAPRNTIAAKHPRLPAGFYTARSALSETRLKAEWVDIPLDGTDVKLHTFVVHPATAAPTGVVLVMQHGVGLDEWQRALAVQVAEDGFIAIAPDLWSGTGPNGGNWDASEFVDDAMRAAAGKITPAETMRRYKAARDYALKLPQSNGKTGSIGFCAGGGNSFRFASEVPGHNASVVFYGGPPSDDEMARINAPVLGFYGENDARVTATVEPTQRTMTRLGKRYEAIVYPKVTHSFVLFQDIGLNNDAVADAWPRTIQFLRTQLN